MWIVLLAGLPALLSSASVSGITLFGISGTHARTLLRKLSIRSVQNESLMLSTAYRSSRCGCAGVFRQLHLAVVDYIHIAALVLSCFWVQDRPSMSDLDILGIVHESLYFFAWGPCHKQYPSTPLFSMFIRHCFGARCRSCASMQHALRISLFLLLQQRQRRIQVAGAPSELRSDLRLIAVLTSLQMQSAPSHSNPAAVLIWKELVAAACLFATAHSVAAWYFDFRLHAG